ncbi:MAG TPA: hypothetical protein VNK41_02755 [Vicinamibacterales bacterium]|nr:hypothetical protein [Vicinamibacterales bacterium]
MRAENERSSADGEVEVITELRPDGTFASRIVREEGSGYIRNNVLKKMLREEGELRAFTSSADTRASATCASPSRPSPWPTSVRRPIALRDDLRLRFDSGQPVTHEPAPMRAAWQHESVERSDGVPEGRFDRVTAPQRIRHEAVPRPCDS